VKRTPAVALVLLLASAWARGQTRGAELTRQLKPVHPEKLTKSLTQGNVLLIGRVDTHGKLQDLRVGGATLSDFIAPALNAANAWEFRPALRDGQPIDIAINLVMRFRLTSNLRGQIARPILGDLSVFPADASGKRTAPEGFPIARTPGAQVHVEAVLDVSPADSTRQISVKAEAVSPRGRMTKVFERRVVVEPKHSDVKVSFSSPVGADWPDGVWRLRFTADGADAGSGEFWLAGDPERFDFAAALRNLK
jgi:TonB-like protein